MTRRLQILKFRMVRNSELERIANIIRENIISTVLLAEEVVQSVEQLSISWTVRISEPGRGNFIFLQNRF